MKCSIQAVKQLNGLVLGAVILSGILSSLLKMCASQQRVQWMCVPPLAIVRLGISTVLTIQSAAMSPHTANARLWATKRSLMGICWYCHWGWAKPVAEIYQEALRRLDGYESPLDYSASHIVWSDENFEDDNIKWCLEHFDEYKGDYTEDELKVVKWSLEELLKIPEDVRCPEPENYDDEHPELYPPKTEVLRVR